MTMLRFLLLISLLSSTSVYSADIDDFASDLDWLKIANGVWRCEAGDMGKETRYTDFAAASPKLDAINALPKSSFPFSQRKVRYRIETNGRVAVHVPIDADERVFGYGLQFDGSDKTRKILDLKVDHFNRGGGATHAPVPFFISSRGYGVFFNTAKYIKVYNKVGNRKDSKYNPRPVDRNPPPDEKQPGPWLAQPPGDAVEASFYGQGMELIVFSGNSLREVVQKYNLYNGGGAMPPLWGLGFWHRVPSKFSAEETLTEIEQFQKYRIPLDVIGLEPGWQTKSYPCTFEWQKKRFPDPKGFTQGLLKRGIRLNLWENPYISPEAKIYESMYPLSGSHMVWLGIVPDYTLPQAQEILVAQHKEDHTSIGISGYKIDEVDGYDRWLWPDHATFPSGTSAEVMRQTYGMQMQKMMLEKLFRANDQRTYGLVRASNGAASALPFVIYSDSYGHKQYINGISAASLSGILWCPEIRSAGSEREWINRMHTVCFSPLAMLNAWASGTKPWSFPKSTDAVRDVIELRMRLLPYLYSAFWTYRQTGLPPIRSMLLTQENNQGKLVEDNSLFMFGDDILVAPFYEDFAEQRTIVLPAGKWYDFYTGDFVGNGLEITRTALQMKNRLPLFVRGGALIPMLKQPVRNTDQAYGQALELRHYGAVSGSFDLFEDDGKTFGYARGQYRIRHLSLEADGKVTETVEGDGPAMFGEITEVRKMTTP